MTKESLENGQEIQRSISCLKNAIGEVAKVQLFRIDESGCTAYYRSVSDPFLAELQTDIKTLATKRINKKISELEKTFKKL